MKCGVQRIVEQAGRATALILDTGEEVTADHVVSSIGYLETEALYRPKSEVASGASPEVGRLSFVETVNVLNRLPTEIGWGNDTIVFFSAYSPFLYERPAEPVDLRSGVLCIPNNFIYPPGAGPTEGMLRCTCLANYEAWAHLPDAEYQGQKQHWLEAISDVAQRFLPPLSPGVSLSDLTVARDVFTPRTIEKFTGHIAGCVYGSPKKNRQGTTGLSNLYLCGTDQGYLGIVGAMLSGISMANLHVLQKG